MLFACPSLEMAGEIATRLKRQPSVGSSPIRADLIQAGLAKGRFWRDERCSYRAEISLTGAVTAGTWAKASLPAEPAGYGPLGYFDPRTVSVWLGDRKLSAKVDFFRSVYHPSEGVGKWSLNEKAANARIEADLQGVKIVSMWARQKPGAYGLLRFAGTLDPPYDILEVRHRLEGNFVPLLGYQKSADGKKTTLNFASHLREAVWSQSEQVPPLANEFPLSRLYWQKAIEKLERSSGASAQPWKTTDATLSAQIYDGLYQFGEIRQCKSAPDVFVQLPSGTSGNQRLSLEVYWDYTPFPCAETPCLAPNEKPAQFATALVKERDGFQIAAVSESKVMDSLPALDVETEAQVGGVWGEIRNAAGTLLWARNLSSKDRRHWRLAERTAIPPDASSITVLAASASGRVVAYPLKSPPRPTPLRELARVAGQVETLSCSGAGDWLLVGADKLYAFTEAGRLQWTVDLGENRRQHERFGPGRNIEQAEVRPDGQVAFARTFRWDAKTRRYEPSFLEVLSTQGRRLAHLECDWTTPAHFTGEGLITFGQIKEGKVVRAALEPTTGALTNAVAKPAERPLSGLPPYTAHKLFLKDGRVILATTQGFIQCVNARGQELWSRRRLSRLDAAQLMEVNGTVAIASKRYLNRWDWQCVPIVELLSVTDGQTRALFEGKPADDFGNFGTDLQLAASQDGTRLYLGGPDGRIYTLNPRL